MANASRTLDFTGAAPAAVVLQSWGTANPPDMLAVTPASQPDLRCRSACAACCIAPSISSPIPGMPEGKPAGIACVQLDEELRCRLFGKPERPTVCSTLRPSTEMCGADREQAMVWLAALERQTLPAAGKP